jgi:hypothetical protein
MSPFRIEDEAPHNGVYAAPTGCRIKFSPTIMVEMRGDLPARGGRAGAEAGSRQCPASRIWRVPLCLRADSLLPISRPMQSIRANEMAKFRLLVTDVTNYGDLRCVAGWDIDRKKMIRPEPHPLGFWQSSAIGPKGFQRSSIAEFEAQVPSPSTSYPHRTEDRVVVGAVNNTRNLSPNECNEVLEESKTSRNCSTAT